MVQVCLRRSRAPILLRVVPGGEEQCDVGPGSTTRRADHRSDVALAQAVGQGDDTAVRQMAERLFDRTRATVRYLCGNDRDADDLAQSSLLEVLRSAGSFRGECSLERWADRITTRTTLRRLKRRRFREGIVGLAADPAASLHTAASPAMDRVLLRGRIATVLGTLTPERRATVTLHWVLGYRVAEIAEIMATPINTVRDRLRVAKKQLRSRIMKDPGLAEWVRSVLHEEQ